MPNTDMHKTDMQKTDVQKTDMKTPRVCNMNMR